MMFAICFFFSCSSRSSKRVTRRGLLRARYRIRRGRTLRAREVHCVEAGDKAPDGAGDVGVLEARASDVRLEEDDA